MAEGFNIEDHLNERFEQEVMGKIAHKVYPQHLERFATTLLKFKPAAYYHKTHGHDNWNKVCKVRGLNRMQLDFKVVLYRATLSIFYGQQIATGVFASC